MRPFPAAPASGTLAKVGANAATIIRDGDTIQIGIGKVQSAVLANLFDRRDLGLHSGMIDDAIAALGEKGVITNTRKSIDAGLSIPGIAIGTEAVSRIVPVLASPGIATGPRNDCDIVVTEHGIARLRDLTLDARAEALIAIAHPAHRSALTDAWRDMRKAL